MIYNATVFVAFFLHFNLLKLMFPVKGFKLKIFQ